MARTILISAGHSNIDPGIVRGQLREADFTLLLRNKISKILVRENFPHILDGEGGVNYPLKEAIKLEKTIDGTRLEIHFNGGLLAVANGTEVLSLPIYKTASQLIAKATSDILKTKLRGDNGWKDQAKAGPHSRLGFCIMGGIILEVCFLTNAKEMEKLAARIDSLAESLAKTLIELNN